MSLEFHIARRYMSSKHRLGFVSVITAISIGGVIIGTAALVIVLSVMNGFEEEVRSRIIGTGSDIIVSHVTGQPISEWRQLREQIDSVAEVVATSPIIQSKCAIASKTETDGVVVMAIIPEEEAKVSRITDYMLTKSISFNTQDSNMVGIWLGVNLADRLSAGLNEKVKLFSLKEAASNISGFIPKAMNCQVAGIFETGMYEYDANMVYIPLESAQSLFNLGDRITAISVKTNDYNRAEIVGKKIDSVIGYKYYSTSWKTLNKNLFSWMTLEKWASFIILSLIIAVAAFNIISSLIMIVLEKRKEIGILMSLGMSNNRIKKIFIYQGITIGSFGGGVGCLIGYIVCYIQYRFHVITLPAEYYFISALPIKMQLLDFVSVGLAAFILSFLATLYPSARAARMNPVEAIRYE
ncbi:MAG: FtsX-like permease family protein [candidate division Zixibacteria bacterium]|jgi:lipoprotein-releasing system permease protein|nr:FtsX-like permease family protein [candidate division Zixibacteria bacterium]